MKVIVIAETIDLAHLLWNFRAVSRPLIEDPNFAAFPGRMECEWHRP